MIAILAGILILVLRKHLKVSFKNKREKLDKLWKQKLQARDNLLQLNRAWNNNLSRQRFATRIQGLLGKHTPKSLLPDLEAIGSKVDLITSTFKTIKSSTIERHMISKQKDKLLTLTKLVSKFKIALEKLRKLQEDRKSISKKYNELFEENIKPLLETLRHNLSYSDNSYSNNITNLVSFNTIDVGSIWKKLKSVKKNKKNLSLTMAVAAPIVSIFMGIFGFLGTISTAIFSGLYFSEKSFNKTTDLVRKLEGLEKEFPGILTSEQKLVLAKFKKLAGDLTIQAILQNMELKAKLTILVNTLIQQNKALTEELGGAEEAQKTLEKYFTRRLRKALLKKNLDTTDAKLKALGIKLFYNRAKNKVASMEKKYPMLQSATKDAVQEYMKEANKTLEKFNELLADAIVEGKITPKVKLEPIIPL